VSEFTSSLERKAMMYEMLLAIENDFIDNFTYRLSIEDIPKDVVEHANRSESTDAFRAILEGIDIQSYIQICNANISKLEIGVEEKNFLNKDLSQIIKIRNNVMHPRPLGSLDFYLVKGVFDEIDQKIKCLDWKNVEVLRKKIIESPESLRLPPANSRKSDSIIENIPVSVDFEDTNFIGRKEEVGAIKEKLNKNNVHILSIIGDGGIGKTAIAIKVLYDLLDDPKCKFNLILWTSLKTNELNNYEFKEIKAAISTTSEMYSELSSFVGNDDIQGTEEYLISLAKEFDMLLVLDNLETINTEEIKDFLDRFTEYGKVLITSRIGLGEMEHRFKLGGMSDNDVIQYMNTLLELYGFESLLTEKQKKDIAVNELHSNPLAIKWFIRCLYNGDEIGDILKNKSELARFCMSNVFDKLSPLSHQILEVLIIAKRDITVAELIYYMDKTLDDYKDISFAINELAKCNFIDDSIFRINERLSVTLFAKEYLLISNLVRDKAVEDFKQKDIKLQSFLQKQIQNTSEKPYAMRTFYISNERKDELVVAYWLYEAIEAFEQKNERLANAKIELAKRILPGYFECYKVAAYVCGVTSIEKGKEEYEIAENCCEEEYKERLYICYAAYLLRINDYHTSLEKLKLAALYSKEENAYIIFEQAKLYACINKFTDAYSVLEKIDKSKLTHRDLNILYTRLADVKRRESENYKFDEEKKLSLLKEAYYYLNISDEPDRGIYQYACVILKSLSYMYYYDESVKFMCEILEKYHKKIRKESEFKKVRDNISSHILQINNEEVRNEVQQYLVDDVEIMNRLNQNEGVVYVIDREKGFAFFKNNDNPQGVYLKLVPGLDKMQIGSVVKYDKIIETAIGKRVNRIICVK
jgi:hypothetical protein